MEDVVLHCRVGPQTELSSLLRTTQNLLEPFPCRIAPVFTPWFPSSCHRPPLRPARPPPTVNCSGEEAEPEDEPASVRTPPPITCTEKRVEPASPDPPLGRSWVVAKHRVRGHAERSMSKRLRDAMSIHKLHPLHRAHWVIHQDNCGSRRNLEQVWRALCRTLRAAPLPSCTATILRDRAEVWVFCDLQQAEQVGRHLRGALQLDGSIHLSVRKVPNILSM